MSEQPQQPDVTTDNATRETYDEYSVDDEDQLQPEDTLVDRGVDDALDEGYSPPDRIPASHNYGNTVEEQREGESLEQRIDQEVPEEDPYEDAEEPPGLDSDTDQWAEDMPEDARAGRLVAPDEGVHPDHEQAPLADDVGIDGAGASAEEAAMHVEGDL